jgi:uncharacterized protein
LAPVPEPFQVVVKPGGARCNLNCHYCFYLEKESLFSPENNFCMPPAVLEMFIRQKIEFDPAAEVHFTWQGGEPTLLGIDFFRTAVTLQKKYANGKKIANSFQTNGILLDDDWCNFFRENNFLIGLSIDGPQELHNLYRRTKNDQGSFKLVMRGLELLKKHQVDFNTLTAVHKHNADSALEVYQFLKETGSGFMQFIPIVERIQPDTSAVTSDVSQLTQWSVGPKQYGTFLCSIFDEWVRKDVARQYVQLFDVALEAWVGMEASLCVFKETCGQAPALEHNGDLYSCDHFVYPENKLGNIMKTPLSELILSEKQSQFGSNKLEGLPQYCRECNVRFICNGACPKHRFIKTPDGEEGLNYLCEGYKKFFTHIAPYMRFMANELQNQRPPANVMRWAKEKDQGFPLFKVTANDPCPCGSGIKFKKCCAL